MRAILFLAVVPVLIGGAAWLSAREPKAGSLGAAIATTLFLFIAAHVEGADMALGWVATLLVLPLPIAFAVATVAFLSGRLGRPRVTAPEPDHVEH